MSHILVEAAVESLSAALAAAEGGAQRVEYCTDLASGGTTPPLDVLPKVAVPVFVLIRPRAGDFVYTDDEHRTMLRQIAQAKAVGAHGIVSGALTDEGDVEAERTAELIGATRPLPFTFHRAIDIRVYTRINPALEILIKLGVERVLTSGGANTAPEGAKQIARYVQQAKGRITILPGGGIDASNVAQLVRETGVNEIHFSVKDANKVRAVLAQV